MLCALAHEAGVPPGVLNVVTCSRGKVAPVGDLLAQSHVVRKVSFTGSTAVGKTLTAACASTMKRVSMELGGNAPFIVFEDADIAAVRPPPTPPSVLCIHSHDLGETFTDSHCVARRLWTV